MLCKQLSAKNMKFKECLNLRDIDGTGKEAIAMAKIRPKMPMGNSHFVKCKSLVVCYLSLRGVESSGMWCMM